MRSSIVCFFGRVFSLISRYRLQQHAPFEQMLELACGTGGWTRTLLSIGPELTAIDASLEMLALARQKVGNALVQFQQADLFQWQPGQLYELVSFAYWVSLDLHDGSMPFLPLSPVPSNSAALSRWWISMRPCKRIARSACSAKRVQLFVNNAPGWPGGLAA